MLVILSYFVMWLLVVSLIPLIMIIVACFVLLCFIDLILPFMKVFHKFGFTKEFIVSFTV